MSTSPTGFRTWLAVYLKGACMGAADTVPGVSGGTIAMILGVYERLIRALTAFDPRLLRHFPRVHTSEGRAALAFDLQSMDAPFLLILGAGVLSAAATVATAMNFAYNEYPVPTFAFFFGLIAASAVVLYRNVDVGTPRRLAVALAGFAFAFVLTGATVEGAFPTTPLTLFLVGSIAISAMVLPGVSGAFLLLILGQYEFVSGLPRAVAEAAAATVRGGDPAALVDAAIPFISFMLGALVGVFSVAYGVRAALKRYRKATLAFLVSLMVGALRFPAEQVVSEAAAFTPSVIAIVFVSGLLGALAVICLDWYTDDLEY